jgi:heme exporter protein CcmD
MGELGRHAGYIIASYAAAVMIVGVLVAQSISAYRSMRARLGAQRDDG